MLRALMWLGERPAIIHTDSRYVVDGLNSWCRAWERRGWMRKDKGHQDAAAGAQRRPLEGDDHRAPIVSPHPVGEGARRHRRQRARRQAWPRQRGSGSRHERRHPAARSAPSRRSQLPRHGPQPVRRRGSPCPHRDPHRPPGHRFDRLELDAWMDAYIAERGRPSRARKEKCNANSDKRHPAFRERADRHKQYLGQRIFQRLGAVLPGRRRSVAQGPPAQPRRQAGNATSNGR